MIEEKELEKRMNSESYSEFEPSSNEGFFQDETESNKSKMIWSEIGHIVHSNRKPQYSLSSILRRTNLFDEQELNQYEEPPVDNVNNVDITLREIGEPDKLDDYNMARKSKTLELLQVTDIIKNVHKEEVKIYLDEIAELRSQILQMSKNKINEIAEHDIMEEKESLREVEERINIKDEEVKFEEKGINTNTNIELNLQMLDSIQILLSKTNNEFVSSLVHKIELFPEVLPDTTMQSTDYEQLLIEKNNYIQRLEDLNIEIQRQLDLRNEQFSSVSLELVKQKSLFAKESENLKKSQQTVIEMGNQMKQLLEKASENEKYHLEQQELFNTNNSVLNEVVQKLEFEKKSLNDFLQDLLNFIGYHIESESILESNFSDLFDNYSKDSLIWESYPNLIEFIIIIDKVFQPLKELLWNKKNTFLMDSETQTNPQNKTKTKLNVERISNIFIQSISNLQNQNYYEDIPITSNYILENVHKKDFLNKTNNERNIDFVSSVSVTRLRNEINILKNQLDASKQKLKLKDLENKKLSEEISYLKNKIIRNKTYNTSLSNQNFDHNYNENYKLINNLKLNKLSRSKNYYSTLNHNNYSDENWDEIFSVIQQLKGP
ncbi:hypothetical protein [Cryptosporidium parvum Iowa II]|uniref:Uncharacterized protein n=2 Tax=Cryptosporidium parvum TaxID=5807 RepID=Q5CT13_CRYPI|nr:hypothetical protein [Cryptosporidium parvum Iowa II]EAK88508.1 hypothetical protein cgd1_460 [Cryptosporidium parvum Iowa II]QOY43584.1 Uncharacterized protein CPATCC_0038940 [Cryptosporidium parvum]WKS75943.1 hypothetical protein CPCDC_1g460 [Cryptosporidium sp. 43IA8]WRK30436.1 Uncharacterized protein cpbgf_100460 [Cryptosporidium parvum]|eukprot:QOY43584.1 hypothetical protein CPATCC_000385 [Cryptosporidium parvum]